MQFRPAKSYPTVNYGYGQFLVIIKNTVMKLKEINQSKFKLQYNKAYPCMQIELRYLKRCYKE